MKTLVLLTLLSSSQSSYRSVTRLFSQSSSSSNHFILDRSYEQRLQESGYKFIIGVDEAGRGPLAGPVVSAAVMLSHNHITLPFVNDSKKVADKKRQEIYNAIVNDDTVTYAIDVTDSDVIDEINILQATMRSMANCIKSVLEQSEQKKKIASSSSSSSSSTAHAAVVPKEYHVVIDGNKCPSGLKVTATSLVKGDSKVYSIALASILAKCHRDKLMLEYDRMYPEYNFQGHKGYPTQGHVLSLHAYGYSPIHRLSYSPLKGRSPNARYFKEGA